MQVFKRASGVGWLALLLGAALAFASLGVTTSWAQTTGAATKSAGTLEDDMGPSSGDPDMPTGDTPPPSGGSGTTGSIDGGTGLTLHSSSVAAQPGKRFGLWAHWKIALSVYARGLWLR